VDDQRPAESEFLFRSLDFSQPIYQQIVDGLIKAVIRGALKPGDRIPSQREMAARLAVSPNTVQRAYRDLETLGLTETLRGQGAFIRDDPALVRRLKAAMARNAVCTLLGELRELGCGREEIAALVAEELERSSAVGGNGAEGTRPGDRIKGRLGKRHGR